MPHPAICSPPRDVGAHDREINQESGRDILALQMLHRGLLGQYREALGTGDELPLGLAHMKSAAKKDSEVATSPGPTAAMNDELSSSRVWQPSVIVVMVCRFPSSDLFGSLGRRALGELIGRKSDCISATVAATARCYGESRGPYRHPRNRGSTSGPARFPRMKICQWVIYPILRRWRHYCQPRRHGTWAKYSRNEPTERR
jgi:hypothetical protein